VRHRSGPAFFHRQARLRSIERLNLAFFVDREHDRIEQGFAKYAEAFANNAISLDVLPEPTVCALRIRTPR
jgi:hypothetical protein